LLNQQLLIQHATILTPNGFQPDYFILIENNKILSIGPSNESPSSFSGECIDLRGKNTVLPGFIDVHIHGAGGADVMDANEEALQMMASTLPREGTTSFLATTITQQEVAISNALENVAAYRHRNHFGEAEILGVHLEGPFINKKMRGAQPNKYILTPNIELFKSWQQKSGNSIKLVTVAPEMENGIEFVRYLAETNVVASIGHSNANYEEVKQAVLAGATHVTHLFNGMKGMHHREPGTAGSALLFDQLKIELIADGIHVHPEMVRLAVTKKKNDEVILITDSMRAKCLKTGIYDLGGQDVHVSEDRALLSDGTLAGSILPMNKAIQNVTSWVDQERSFKEVVQFASMNPAKQLNVFDRKGSIELGKDADLVIMSDDFDVLYTICRGVISYQKGE
jgi:N-acetylglucosamine-6-phosphate deacetylase